MNAKNNKLIPICIFGFLTVTVTLVACKKVFTGNATDLFAQSEAKEWYYKVFKKSPEWQQSKEKGKKLPDWENGTYRRVGNIEIVEFPLMKERKVFAIPSTNNLSNAEIGKISDGSLSRIAFIKSSSNEIFVRELDYIPEIDFLILKKYDISDTEVSNKGSLFSGRIITKKWNGTILSIRKLKNGRISKVGKKVSKDTQHLRAKSNSSYSPATNNISGCEMVEICEYERYCEEVRVGDTWIPTENCTPWEPTGDCWVEEYCNTGECDYGSSEACECQLYNIGCEDSGGGGEDPPPPPQSPDSTPCDNADSLENNTEYKQKFNQLRGKTSDTKEHGYIYKSNNSGGIDETLITGEDGAAGIDFTVPDKIDGFMHSHYTGLLSVFSPDDLFSIALLYTTDKMVDTKTFTAGVVTANGTQYIIMIDNLTKFHQFASNMVNNSTLDLYSHLYSSVYGINSSNSNEVSEKAFLQYIQQTNSGLKLFKGDSNFSDWQPKKVDENGNIVNNPC